MPQMRTPEQLFEHELQDVYYAEKTIAKMLPKLVSEATTRDLSRAFETHLTETREQIKNLERVFGALGKSAQGTSCPGIDGIKAEHDKFMEEEQPTSDIRDLFLTGAASRTEHYEIAAYTGLISMARKLGEKQVVELLDKNLRQEKEALKKVETISKQILTEATKSNGGGTRSKARSTKRASR